MSIPSTLSRRLAQIGYCFVRFCDLPFGSILKISIAAVYLQFAFWYFYLIGNVKQMHSLARTSDHGDPHSQCPFKPMLSATLSK